jgi:hypothetical protein
MPRDITITFGDGSTHVYKNAPDSVTPDQVEARAAKEFGKSVSGIDGGRKPDAMPNIRGEGFDKAMAYTGRDAQGGALRGAGSIGATLLTPYDMMAGNTKSIGNPERRAAMDEGVKAMGADPESPAFQVAKFGTELAGVGGTGPALAKGVAAIPGAAKAAPNIIEAIRTAGMSSKATGAVGNALTRAIGGGVTGGASAGLIDPEMAPTGVAIGGALPGAITVVGKGANALGRIVSGPDVPASVVQGVKAAQQSGYVIPPSQAKPTLVNRALEGFSGKITTAQNASARNQAVTNKLVATELGLPANTQLSPEILDNVRKTAGQAYEAVGSTGMVQPGPGYAQALDDITASARKAAQGFPGAKPSPLIAEIDSLKSPQFDAQSAIAKISELRDKANAAYSAGDKAMGKSLKSAAGAIEDAIEEHLKTVGAPAQLLDGFRNARQLIAKTYTVQSALNGASGTVNAQKLASQLNKGKPLSGNILAAAKFAQQFPKAAQPLERMGSLPQVSPLDFGALGAMSAATANPALMAGVIARPAARAAVLSPMVQNGLSKTAGPNALSALARNPGAAQLMYRAAPSGLANR